MGMHQSLLANIALLSEPSDQALLAGEEAYFEVVVQSNESIQYQWLYNGIPISGATNFALLISSVDIKHLGYYEVRVSTPTDSVVSGAARLTIGNRASGSVQFANGGQILDVDGGTPIATTNFVAQLIAGPTAQHMSPVGRLLRFGENPRQNPGYVDGGLLSIPTVVPGSFAFAQIRVWDANAGPTYTEAREVGKAGESAVVQFRANGGFPGIGGFLLGQGGIARISRNPRPTAATVVDGGSLEFECIATGSAPVLYRWVGPNGQEVGGNTNRLVLIGVGLGQGGRYHVEALNGLGTARSEPFYINVYPKTMVPGAPDATFATGVQIPAGILTVSDLRDGRILVGGNFGYFDGRSAPGLVRLHRDGRPDGTFRSEAVEGVEQMDVDDSGKILTMSPKQDKGSQVVRRFDRDGRIDPTFRFQSTSDYHFGHMALNRKTGEFFIYEDTSRGVATIRKFSADGTVDPSFNSTELNLMISSSGAWEPGVPVCLIPMEDGSILLAGNAGRVYIMPRNAAPRSIIKMGPQGSIDTEFPHIEGHWLIATPGSPGILVMGAIDSGIFTISNDGSLRKLGSGIRANLGADVANLQREANGSMTGVVRLFDSRLNLVARLMHFAEDGSEYAGSTSPEVGFWARSALMRDGRVIVFDHTATGSNALRAFFGDFQIMAPYLRSIRRSLAPVSVLTFDSQPNIEYTIEESRDLMSWASAGNHSATSSVSRAEVPRNGATESFYRLILKSAVR